MSRRPPRRFEAMGVAIVVGGADAASFARIRTLFTERDAIFSRFRHDSELSRINRSEASVVPISPTFRRAVIAAIGAAHATGGLVDPTLGGALEAAGYDRDFAELVPDERPPGPPQQGTWRDLKLAGDLLVRAPGARIDLNGVVKSMAVDDALALLPGDGFVSAGGDLATRGPLRVELPSGDAVTLRSGGIATSGSSQRAWMRGGERRHHLIDPRTGRPASSCWTDVTVAAGSCLAADVAARTAFLLSERAPEWLDERGLAGAFAAGHGVSAENRTWADLTSLPTAA